MKGMIGAVSLALVCALMAGCARFDVRPGYELARASGKGILAVGLTADDEMPNFYWHLRKIGATEAMDVTFHTVQNPLMWDKPKGRLATIELEEGDYEFFDWQVALGFSPTEFFRIPFSVHAGRVTYLGRLHLDLEKERQRFTVTTLNRFEEDYALLKVKIPNLAAASVDQQEAVFQRCEASSCAKPIAEPVKTTIVIPIVIRAR